MSEATILTRMPASLKQDATVAAEAMGVSLNAWILRAIEGHLAETPLMALNVTPDQRERFQAAADAEGMSLHQWVNYCLRHSDVANAARTEPAQ